MLRCSTGFAVFVALLGCKGEATREEAPPSPAPTDAAPATNIPAGPVGSIAGTVRLDGTPPSLAAVDRSSDPFCARSPAPDQRIVVGEAGGVANALVRIERARFRGPAPAAPVIITQDGCVYSPRVVGAVEGQSLEIRNADDTVHNVHGYDVRGEGDARALYNEAQLARGKPIVKSTAGQTLVDLRCDIHPWMRGFAVVTPHPFFDVTDGDGAFEIRDVPVGRYTLELWHELFGAATAEVTVAEGAAATAAFTLRP